MSFFKLRKALATALAGLALAAVFLAIKEIRTTPSGNHALELTWRTATLDDLFRRAG